MKKIIVFVLINACTVLCCGNESDISVYVKHTLSRFYLGSVGADFSDGNRSLSNEITLSKGDCYAGIWMATGPGDAKYKKDWDPYIGFVHQISFFRYEATATYFVLSNLARMNDDLWSFDQKISSTDKHALRPYVKIRAFNKVGSRSIESGWFGWIGCENRQPFGKADLNTDLSVAYSDGPSGKTPGLVYCRLTTGLSYPLTKTLTVTPSLIYQVPTANQRHVRSPFVTKDQFVWGISIGYPLCFKKGTK